MTSYYTNSLAWSLEQILKALLIVIYLKIGQFLDPYILYFKFSLKDTAENAAIMDGTPGRVGGFRSIDVLELIGAFMLA